MTKKEILVLLIILIIAAFFRLWQLDKIPPGLYPDVAINGNDALETLKTGNFKLFYPENNGREGLMMWLIAFSFTIFGASVWSIKIVAAIIGILTVLGLFLLTKELFSHLTIKPFNPSAIALLSSFLLATSFWHTLFSRIGFRAILLPFILVFGFYFLLKGIRIKGINLLKQSYRPVCRTVFLGLAGLFFGLGFYTYISYRFIVVLLPLILFCWFLIYRRENQTKKFLLFTFYLLFFIFLVALPIGIYFISHPQDFIGRATPISVFATENPIKEFLKSLALHLGMFNFYGDPNWRHNFAGSPMLPLPIGIIFLIGFIISIRELIISLKNKSWLPVTGYGSLFAWFFALLLPGILTYEGLPHSLRVIGVIPVVYIFAALGGYWVYSWFSQKIKNRKLLLVTCYLLLICIAFNQFYKYFFLWGENPNVKGAFTEKFAEIGYYLISLPPNVQKFVIVNEPGVPVPFPNGIPMPAQTPMFIENMWYANPHIMVVKEPTIYLLPTELEKIKLIYKEGEAVFIPMKDDESLFNKLREDFPQGIIKKIDDFSIYETPLEIPK